MKSAIIYYSYSGNTKKVAGTLCEYLAAKGSADIIALEAAQESDNFLVQCFRAFRHRRAALAPVNFDLHAYDMLCFGTPVWAFGPAPAMNAYLEQCSGITAQSVVLFTTYGSGTGNQRCLNYMQEILKKKGVENFIQFSIQQGKVKDKAFVLSKIKECMRL
jgi:flavodoxin